MTLGALWEIMPIWEKLAFLATLWAILCVGVCLPLITLRLFWQNIVQLWKPKPTGPKNWAEIQNLRAQEGSKHASAKGKSDALQERSEQQAHYTTVSNAGKYSQDDSRFQPRS